MELECASEVMDGGISGLATLSLKYLPTRSARLKELCCIDTIQTPKLLTHNLN
jgi:hypothetical protein